MCACSSSAADVQLLDVYVPPPPSDAGADVAMTSAEAGPAMIDRAGHPLVGVMLVPSQLDDSFNAVATFGATPRPLEDAIQARLVALDTLMLGDAGPDQVDWTVPEGGAHPLLPAFATDALLVDTNLSCVTDGGGYVTSYFDIDREVYLGAAPHKTCGGRTPGEDVVSETLTLVVTAGRAPVTQGVAGPTRPAPLTFPYLAPPN
jgi:hypothetical protein